MRVIIIVMVIMAICASSASVVIIICDPARNSGKIKLARMDTFTLQKVAEN